MHTHTKHTTARLHATRMLRGLTIIETAAAAAAVAVAMTAAVPVFRKVGCSAMRAQSAAQLATLSAAHASYAADFNDRQVTYCPDNLGAFNGSWSQYQAANGCVAPLVFGTTSDGQTYVANPGCPGQSSDTGSAFMVPFNFTTNAVGSFRLMNCRPFNTYVGGRYFDQTFYAPDDPGISRKVQRAINEGRDYEVIARSNTSYDYSPAAMYDPVVMGAGSSATSPLFRNPSSSSTAGGFGFRSPTNSQCAHPSLKTRMLERNAIDNSPGANPAYAGGQTPYAWNQSIRSRSLALFFDGSVRVFGTSEAMKAEARAGGAKLWLRNSPLGASGFGGTQSHDFFVSTSVHWLTAMGVLGRDTLEPQ